MEVKKSGIDGAGLRNFLKARLFQCIGRVADPNDSKSEYKISNGRVEIDCLSFPEGELSLSNHMANDPNWGRKIGHIKLSFNALFDCNFAMVAFEDITSGCEMLIDSNYDYNL